MIACPHCPHRPASIEAPDAHVAAVHGKGARVTELRERIKDLEKAIRPFAAAVFNDSGDVTIGTGHLTKLDWMRADAALHHFKGHGGSLNGGKKP